MDRSTVLTLVSTTFTADSIAQQIPVEATRDVFCDLRSVTRAEWSAAGQLGLKPDMVASMFAPDYQGEEIAILDGVRYGIYRTYVDRYEQIELYLERKAGVTNG